MNQIKDCISKEDFHCIKGYIPQYDIYGRSPIHRFNSSEKKELLNLLKKYVALQERYLGSKTNYNKNANRNSYYESERHNRELVRASELEGLF